MTKHLMPPNDECTARTNKGDNGQHSIFLDQPLAQPRAICSLLLMSLMLLLAAVQPVSAQPAAQSKPSQGNPSYIHRAQAGETAESIAFEFLAQAADKQARETFYAHNQIALKDVRKPLRLNQPLNLPVAWMYLKPAVAAVVRATGQAQMSHANTQHQWVAVGAADKLIEEGTLIKTAVNSFVSLRFPDNSVLSLAPQSEARIETLRRYAGSDIYKIKVLLNQGRVESEVKPLNHQAADYSVRSRRLTTGVRGTQFNVNEDQAGNASAEVLEGGVALADASNKSQLVPGGFGSFVAHTRASELIALLGAPRWQCDAQGLPVSEPLPLVFSQAPAAVRLDIFISPDNKQQLLQASPVLPQTLPLGDYRISARGVDVNGLQGYGASSTVSVRQITIPSAVRWVNQDDNQSWVLEETPALTSTRFFCESN